MAKITQLETLIQNLSEQNGSVAGCAVVSRAGQGDMLYQAGLEGMDSSFLSTVISSILLIGEKLGHDLDGQEVGHTWIDYGRSAAVILPCSEGVALLALVKDTAEREAVIGAVCGTARQIGDLLRNKAAGL